MLPTDILLKRNALPPNESEMSHRGLAAERLSNCTATSPTEYSELESSGKKEDHGANHWLAGQNQMDEVSGPMISIWRPLRPRSNILNRMSCRLLSTNHSRCLQATMTGSDSEVKLPFQDKEVRVPVKHGFEFMVV